MLRLHLQIVEQEAGIHRKLMPANARVHSMLHQGEGALGRVGVHAWRVHHSPGCAASDKT
jgi:hypothetical protein